MPIVTVEGVGDFRFQHTFIDGKETNIVCMSCSQKNWCEHMETAIKSGADQAFIWNRTFVHGEEYQEMDLSIPIFPSLGLWTVVQLVPFLAGRGDRGTWLYEVRWEKNSPLGIPGMQTVCYLNPGEGRKVIREVLIEYMWADPTRPTECRSPLHQFSEEMIWIKNVALENRTLWVADQWSLYDKKVCVACMKKSEGVESFEDAIPSREGSPWNPHD